VIGAAGHPVTFLLAINLACAALGLAQFGYSLAVLKPADFAVIGVLVAISGVVTGLLDVKLGDLTSKLYFAVPKEDGSQRAEILAASLCLHVAAGLIATVLIMLAGALLASRLLERSPEGWWMGALAIRIGLGYPLAAFNLFPRLVGDYFAAGRLRLVTQLVVTLFTIAVLIGEPNLNGYFAGALVGAGVSTAIALIVSCGHAERALGAPILRLAPSTAMRAHLGSVTFLTSTWFMGAAKVLSSACDTLLVAALTSDTTAGLYRIARQAYDSLSGLAEAVHQFYTPTIVDCLSRGRWPEFNKHRRRLMVIGAIVAFGTLALSWHVLRPLAHIDYPQYSAALPAFEVLAGLFLVTLGVHGWLWPLLVVSNRVRSMSIMAFAGAVAQVSLIWALGAAGLLDQTTAAATSWLAFALTYGPTLFVHRRSGTGVVLP
jgi:O-antigen/teichoic acid export membrane protein